MANSSPPSLRNDVGFPQTTAQALGDGLEQFVAALVAERVVDALEFVEVQIKHRELLAAPDALERLLELLAEEHPVGQIGQRIVVRQMRDPLLRDRFRSVTSSITPSRYCGCPVAVANDRASWK